MNQIILNEKEYAENCLRTRSYEQPTFQTLSILARYFYHVKGFRKKRIIIELTNYLDSISSVSGFYKNKFEDVIEKLAANAGKFKLHEIDGVKITESELETIDSINGKVLRRLAFTMLCLAKLGNARNENNKGWVHMDSKDIFKLARISCGVDERDEKIGKLYQLGLLEFPKRNDNMDCRVTFIDDKSNEKLFIYDFRELGYEYLKYCGEKFIRCSECNILTRANKNDTKKYCPNCIAPSSTEYKTIICADCGEPFEINTKNNSTKRCPYCYDVYRREYYRLNKIKQRNLRTLSTEQKKDEEEIEG